MKNIKKKFIILSMILILMITLIGVQVFATDTTEEGITEEITEEIENATTTYNSDLYVIYGENGDDNTYIMDDYVEGNAFIIAEKVEISGQINGSLYVIASELTITEEGYVASDLFAIANTLTINGFVYDVYAIADTFNTEESALIYRDVKVIASDMNLRGIIGRNLYTEASNIDVYDEDSQLYVGGDLKYSSENEIKNIDKITVEGTTSFTQITVEETTTSDTIYNYIYKAIQNIIYTLIIYLFIIFIAPEFIKKSKEYVDTRAFLAGAIGLCFTFLVPIIALLVLVAIGGFSLTAFILIVYAIVLMMSNAVVNAVITEFLISKVDWINNIWKKILIFIAVSLIVFILKELPYIGTVVSIIVFLVGVGVMVLYQFDKRKKVKAE